MVPPALQARIDPIGKAQPRKPREAWTMLGLVALAEFLGLTLWFSATAVTPALTRDLQLTGTEQAWLTMAVQAGFVVGTFASAFANLPDLVNARWLFAIGSVAGALTTSAVAASTTATAVILWRALTGMALACVYPPGMKIAASWFEQRRGTALGIVVGALTLGSAFPHLLAWSATGVPWRHVLYAAAALAVVGGFVVVAFVRDGPYLAVTARFDAGSALRVFRAQGTRLATFGYLGHMWELYAMWTWFGLFAASGAVLRGSTDPARFGSLAAAVAIGSGAIGCVIAGLVADRVGKSRVAGASMLCSGACAAAAGLAYAGHPALVIALAAAWGFTIVADSAQFSALIAQHSPRDHVGTALTIQMCSGFLLTIVSIRLVPMAAEVAGPAWMFAILVPGPLLGAAAMRRLERVTSS